MHMQMLMVTMMWLLEHMRPIRCRPMGKMFTLVMRLEDILADLIMLQLVQGQDKGHQAVIMYFWVMMLA